MTLEEWSWIAAIAAIPLGVFVWLVERKQILGFCARWWKVIIFIFVVAGLVVASCCGWFKWLARPVTLSLWVLIIVGFLIFSVPAVIMFFAKVSTIEPEIPRPATPFEYTSDEIFGVDWLWEYRGSVLADRLDAFCPNKKCMCRLTMRGDPERMSITGSGYGKHVATPISLICSNCNFSKRFDSDWKQLKHAVFIEIERRIRTGEFQERLSQANPET